MYGLEVTVPSRVAPLKNSTLLIVPPDSEAEAVIGIVAGAVNVALQSVCPGVTIQHSQLPSAPLVVGLVLRTLSAGRVTAPAPGDCAALESLGR